MRRVTPCVFHRGVLEFPRREEALPDLCPAGDPGRRPPAAAVRLLQQNRTVHRKCFGRGFPALALTLSDALVLSFHVPANHR